MARFTCTDIVNSLGNDLYECTGDMSTSGNDLLLMIDPATAVTYVGAGFFVLMPLWAAVVGGRVILRSIT